MQCTYRGVNYKDAPERSQARNEYRRLLDGYGRLFGIVGYHQGREVAKEPCLPTYDYTQVPQLAQPGIDRFWLQLPNQYQPNFATVESDVLCSFGSKSEAAGFNVVAEFIAIMDGSGGSGYLDALELPRLLGAYRKREDVGDETMHISLNSYWKQYYQQQIKTSKAMVFFVTDAWLDSENCWEELNWAREMRPADRETAKGFINFVLLYSTKAQNLELNRETNQRSLRSVEIIDRQNGKHNLDEFNLLPNPTYFYIIEWASAVTPCLFYEKLTEAASEDGVNMRKFKSILDSLKQKLRCQDAMQKTLQSYRPKPSW